MNKNHFWGTGSRRWLWLAMLVSVVMPVQGQYSHLYYHRVGDTLMYDAPIYYHNWWGFEEAYANRRLPAEISCQAFLPNRRFLSYYFTGSPLKVLGLAMFKPIVQNRGQVEYADTLLHPEYLYLYEADTKRDSAYEVGRVSWSIGSPTRNLYIRSWVRNNISDTVCCGGQTGGGQYSVAEYYFDSAIVVDDSFYVGYSRNYENVDNPMMFEQVVQYHNACNRFLWVNCEGESAAGEEWYEWGTSICGILWPSILYKAPWYTVTANMPDKWYCQHIVPMVFPIIQVDTTVPPAYYCPPVENLQVHGTDSESCDVTWDAFLNHQHGYEVQYGPRNVPQSQWQSVYAGMNFTHIEGLNPALYYALRVRPRCEGFAWPNYDGGEYDGQWCETVYFHPSDLHDAGMEPSPIARHTTVMPNPATEQVTVRSDFVIVDIDLYDAQGVHLWNISSGSISETLDVSGLAAGRYTLMVKTAHGITAKPLIIAR